MRVVMVPTEETTRRPLDSEDAGADDAPTSLFVGLSESLEPAHPLVGQDPVLAAIRHTLRTAYSASNARLLLLQGEAGSGKTRLLMAASELAAKAWIDLRIVYALAPSKEGGPFTPISRLLLERFGVSPASAPAQVRADMAAAVAMAVGSQGEQYVTDTTHLLGFVAGVPFPDSPLLARLVDRPRELERRAGLALADFFRGDADKRPLLLLVDDLDHAGHGALPLLGPLLSVDAPIAIVATGGPAVAERIARLEPRERVSVSSILALDDYATEQLIRVLVPALKAPPAELVAALRHRTAGNPAALRALIENLRATDLFRQDGERLVVDMERLERGDLPITLADALRARLADLPNSERRLLDCAAVVGERFWDGALLALQRAEVTLDASLSPLAMWRDQGDEDELSDTLEILGQKRLIVETTGTSPRGSREYTFYDARLRSVLYADLDEDARRSGHAIVARWLREARSLDGLPELIAPHLLRSGQPGEAGRAFLQAALAERTRLRTTMALRLVERALPLLAEDDVDRRMDALHEQGSVLTVLGQYDEAEEAFEQMLRLAWSLGARGRAGAAIGRLSRIRRKRGELGEALAYLEIALSLFREANDSRGVASTFDDLAQLHRLRGANKAALAAAREALAMRTRLKDKRGQAVSLNTIGQLELDRGDFHAAESHFKTALALREATRDHEGAVQTRMALGRLSHERGDFLSAIETYRGALAPAREMDDRGLQSHLLNVLGEACLAAGRLGDARAWLLEARQMASDLEDNGILADIERNLGLIALALGDHRAGAMLQRALTLAVRHGTRDAVARAHLGIARLRARAPAGSDVGERATPAAETCFETCIRLFGECGSAHQRARSQAEFGYFLLGRGQLQQARAQLSEAETVLARLALPEHTRVRETLSGLR